MSKKKLFTMVLAGLLGSLQAQNNSAVFREMLLDAANKDVFVVAYRGDWHGTAENSLHAIQKAVEKGAQVALLDLQRTKDGELVAFSDATLDRLTTGSGPVGGLTLDELRNVSYKEYQGDPAQAFIPTWKEVLDFAHGKILIAVNPGEYYEQALKEAEGGDMLQEVIICGAQCPKAGVMYMPVVDLDGIDAMQQLANVLKTNPVAVELRYRNDDNVLLPQAVGLLKGKCRVCLNTCGGLAGSHDDSVRQRGAEQIWGGLVQMGATVLVTNQIKPLLRYLHGETERPQQASGNAVMQPRGPQTGRRPGMDKPEDPALKAMIAETVGQFVQREFQDVETGKTMPYNLFVPKDYDASQPYPLIMFIGDASTVSSDVTKPLTQGYGGIIWATEKEQAKHPCFVLVPQYSTVTVSDNFTTSYEVEMTIRLLQSLVNEYNIDTKRLYTTGQSMGGMMSMYFNISHPDLFAASLYAGCQWDTSKMAHFANQNFFYIVAAGDPKASVGMAELKTVLAAENAPFGQMEWSAKLPQSEQEANAKALIAEGNHNNFVVFTLKSVLAPDGSGHEHMSSFDYVYKLEAVRDWLFEQTK